YAVAHAGSCNGDATALASLAHGIESIVQDVEEYLLKLVRISGDVRQRRIKLLHEFNTFVAQVVCAQRNCPPQHLMQIDGLLLRRTLTRKTKQITHNFARALSFVH